MTQVGERVLCVDGEPSALDVMRRVLGTHYEVTSVDRPDLALAMLRKGPPFAVVVSDFEMPGLHGVRFLRAVRRAAPLTVRVLVSGGAQVQDAAAAVNEGQVFRFLTKPVTPEALLAAMDEAVAHHRTLVAERDILANTVRGAVDTLADVLALAQPTAFGRAKRLRRHVADLAAAIDAPNAWEIEVAALLSQLGCISLPSDTMERLYRGQPLLGDERTQVARIPVISEELVAHIPRLDAVREIIHHQERRFDGGGAMADEPVGADIPLGARMLRIARDFDFMVSEGLAADRVLDLMAGRRGVYDPDLLGTFRKLRGSTAKQAPMRDVRLGEVTEGMVFASDLVTASGMLLVARGQVVTSSLLCRIREQWSDAVRRQAVRMVVPT
jgi:response regulator RpfG family c-di-GMP phosphodiesterase